jgi:hypothetical protein
MPLSGTENGTNLTQFILTHTITADPQRTFPGCYKPDNMQLYNREAPENQASSLPRDNVQIVYGAHPASYSLGTSFSPPVKRIQNSGFLFYCYNTPKEQLHFHA